jgi:deoxycytidylate deaminase
VRCATLLQSLFQPAAFRSVSASTRKKIRLLKLVETELQERSQCIASPRAFNCFAGGSIYCTLFPCVQCAKKIIHAGITEVFPPFELNPPRNIINCQLSQVIYAAMYPTERLSMQLFDTAKVQVKQRWCLLHMPHTRSLQVRKHLLEPHHLGLCDAGKSPRCLRSGTSNSPFSFSLNSSNSIHIFSPQFHSRWSGC